MRRALLVLLAVLVLLPVLAAAGFALWFDEAALKAKVADAVRRATGRELTVAGPVGIGWSFTPTLRLRDVRLANPPGFSRADTVTLGLVEARVALWPLLSRRVEVRNITVERPDVLLERDAAGRGNWEVVRPAAVEGAPAPADAPRSRVDVVVNGLTVRDGRFAWRGGGHPVVVRVPQLQASMARVAAPVQVAGELLIGGGRFTLAGSAGTLGAAAPVDLRLEGEGGVATVRGLPADGLDFAASIADLSALSVIGGPALPPVRDIRASARVAGGLQSVSVQTGAAELGAFAPGLALAYLSLAAPAPDQPVVLTAEGASRGQKVALAAKAGSLASLLGGGAAPVKATLAAAGASVSVQGNADLAARRWVDGSLFARAPDLAALGAVFGVALPAASPLSLDARLLPAPDGVAMRGLRLSAPQGDVAGDVVVGWAPRPSLRGSLVSQRLDLDGLMAAQPVPAPAPPAPGPEAQAGPVTTSDRVLPDTPLQFAALRRADADLRLAVGEAVLRGASYRNAEGRILLQDGRLRLDPWRVTSPGGAVVALVTVDASAEVPAVAVALTAPGLAAGPLLGAPDGTVGTIEVDVSLVGRGNSVRQLAASLDGHLGLAMVDGELDNAWLLDLLGQALRGVDLPFDRAGRSRVRCLAVRLESAGGQAAVRALTLDTTRLRLDGEGGVNLANETLDLRLRPLVRLRGTGVGVSVKVGGTFRAPRPVMDAGAGPPGAVGALIGALTQPGHPVEDGCEAALLLARGGRAGAAPPPAAPVGKPADLLRGLFR